MAAKRKKVTRKLPVAYRDGTVADERLPYPFIHYPGHYGAFLGFSTDSDATPVLCSCSLDAVANYLEYRIKDDLRNVYPERQFILSSTNFPIALVRRLMETSTPRDERLIEYLPFGDHLCHQCNRATPSLRYCHEMYGGVFKQTYGWYIARKAFELGFHPVWSTLITDRTSDEIQQLAIPDHQDHSDRRSALLNRPQELASFDSETAKRRRRLWNIAENEVRLAFGHNRIGDAWTSETILYSIVRRLWPDLTIRRHWRPPFLDGLELDMFVPEKTIGIEYQGIQHYQPVSHWGGAEGLAERQKRDETKLQLCKSNGVEVVYFEYHVDLSEDLVESRLRPFLGDRRILHLAT